MRTTPDFMRPAPTYRIAKLSIVAAFGIFGLTACSDDSTTTGKSGTDSSTVSNNSSTTANTAGATVRADSSAASASGSAAAAKTTHKKRSTSIMMPMGSSEKMMKDNDGVYNRAEVMPEFPGGQTALSGYVNNHIDYPQAAVDGNDTGTVKISFVVDENGKVMNAKLTGARKVGSGLDDEALRVVSGMPAWKPGKVHGKNVKTRLELPIAFQLES